jgi:thioester reductase-like protein
MSRTVCITGGDGYLGVRIAEQMLRESDAKLVLWVHANSSSERDDRKERLMVRFAAHAPRITVAAGELAAAAPFDDVDPSAISEIVHTAAVTTFNVDAQTAQRVNVEGARRVAEFARRCKRLQSLVHLSTVYASGLTEGIVPETRLEREPCFANHYEASKWRSETMLAEEFGDLPWRIVRVATVVSDDESGNVGQLNVVHRILRLMQQGLLPIVPGSASTPLYFVTGEFVVSAFMRLVTGLAEHEVLHLCHSVDESPTLKFLLDTAYASFLQDAQFKSRRVLKPLITDEFSFNYMADHVEMFSEPALGRVVALMRPFAKQLFVKKTISNARVSSLESYAAADFGRTVPAICKWLLTERWENEKPRVDASSTPTRLATSVWSR